MPHIIVTADETIETGQNPVMLRERVTCADFESSHFASQLVERLGWAVGDAAEVERRRETRDRPRETRDRQRETRERPREISQPRSARVVTTAS
jgi:hypothetical protein